jgi:hypothetical protein
MNFNNPLRGELIADKDAKLRCPDPTKGMQMARRPIHGRVPIEGADMKKRNARRATQSMRRALAAVGLMLTSGVIPVQANADDCLRVCITDLHQDGSNLHVAWTAKEAFAFYEVYSEQQGTIDIRTNKVAADQFAFDIPDVKPGASYRVQVLGCGANTPWYTDGPCGAVDQRIITT